MSKLKYYMQVLHVPNKNKYSKSNILAKHKNGRSLYQRKRFDDFDKLFN